MAGSGFPQVAHLLSGVFLPTGPVWPIGTGDSSRSPEWSILSESRRYPDKTHNPFEEAYWVSCLRENLTSSSYGEGLETGQEL
jgi:hypothetical protein